MAKAATPRKAPAPNRTSGRSGAAEPVRQTKKQIAHGRKEARGNLIIWLSVAALSLVILGILAAGIINQVALKPAQAVALVDKTKIRKNDYEALVQYQRANLEGTIQNIQNELQTLDPTDQNSGFLIQYYQQMVSQYQTQLASVEKTALDDMIDDALIAEKAKASGIQVTADDVQKSINDDLTRIAATNTTQVTTTQTATSTEPTPTPTPVPQATLDQIYQSALTNLELSDKQFRTILQRNLVRIKVQDLLQSQVVTSGLVVHVQMIVTNTKEIATAAETRINSGEDMATVAASVDPQAKQNGGDVGWLTKGQASRRYGQPLEDWVLAQQPGAIGVVESNAKFYVVKVLERDENGTLPTDQITYLKDNALSDWLAARKASPDVKIERLITPIISPTQTPVVQPTP